MFLNPFHWVLIDIIHDCIKIGLISDNMIIIIPLPEFKSCGSPKKMIRKGLKPTNNIGYRTAAVIPGQSDKYVDMIRKDAISIDTNPGGQNRNLMYGMFHDNSGI